MTSSPFSCLEPTPTNHEPFLFCIPCSILVGHNEATKHLFIRKDPAKISGRVDLIYQCSFCGTERVYGQES